MILSETAVRRSVLTSMVIAGMVVFGLVSYKELGVDLMPRVEFPFISIVTVLKGADPETIETTVTDPIEEAVNTCSGIKSLQSTSADGISQVGVEFELEKSIDVAYQEIQAKVGAIRSKLPQDIDAPIIEKMDIDAAPVMSVLVSGDRPMRELTRMAKKLVKEPLERVRNVGSVKMVGGRERKIWLWLDREKLESHGVTVQDVQAALQREHVEVPGGRVETGPLELSVKTKAELEDAAAFNRMVVANVGGNAVRLQDVGYAEDGIEEERSFAKLNDKPAVALLVRRQSGTNTVQVAHDVKKRLAALQEELEPQGLRMEIAKDMSVYIEQSVEEVQFHILFGGALAILIVMVFLRNLRSTFISALVIPTAIVATFMLMHANGFTLNMMTLLALSLSVGLLIDDSIVVQENTMRHVEEGKPAREAALFATDEIGLAVFATTMSVVAVFLPVAFMKGIVGRFFYPFALTVSFAVMISMFVSFTLDPMLSSRLLRRQERPNFLARAIEAMLGAVDRAYGAILGGALRFRWLVVLLALGVFASSLYVARYVRTEFVPVEDQSEFSVKVRAPLGASLDRTRGILEKIRERLRDQPWLNYTFYTIGADEIQRVNEGEMYVKMADKGNRAIGQEGAMAEARKLLKGIADAQISVEIVQRITISGRKTAQVQFDLRGPDLDVLDRSSRAILDELRTRKGYVDLDTTFETGKPEADVYVDRERIADLGLSPYAVASTVRIAIGGLDVAKFKAEGDRYDIAVRFLEPYRNTVEAIDALKIRSAKGNLIDMRSVANVKRIGSPVEINRYNRQRHVTVLANLEGKVLGQAVGEINEISRGLELPPGYTTYWTGFAEVMAESFAYLFFALELAVIVVYMVLASQFESFVHPFTIMLSLPLSVIGALGALLVTGMTICIFSLIGIIMLMGLVTKNAILLIDYTNTLRTRDKMARDDAVLKAGPVRLRPILMTTLAMIFGMMPVAIGMGAGSESRQPMAVAVIGGLMTSTLLTLVVVPVVYTLMDDLIHSRVWNLFRRKGKEAAEA